jgi:hypothetical protein
MPEHGRADAPQACCRPALAAVPGEDASGFWRHGPTWWRAGRNTAHCLLGCAIGDIAAMTLIPVAWPEVPLWLLMGAAIVAGITTSLALETAVLRLRDGLAWGRALTVAWGMSLLSMVAMEVVMNLTDWLAMGGARMPLDHPGYWLAWIPALAAGFLAPLPYTYAKLRRHGRSCH